MYTLKLMSISKYYTLLKTNSDSRLYSWDHIIYISTKRKNRAVKYEIAKLHKLTI